jgi:hypothetical protein
MRLYELIEELQELPGTAEVVVPDLDGELVGPEIYLHADGRVEISYPDADMMR